MSPLLSAAIAFTLLLGCSSASEAPAEQAVAQPAVADNEPSDGPSDTESDAGETEADDGAAQAERTDDEPSVNDAYSSPIFDALGFDPNDQAAAQAEFVQNAEELVRQCMADAGFDYVPSVPGAPPSIQRLWELNASISPEQFRDEYGYGIGPLLELDFFDEGILAFAELVIGPPPTAERTEAEQAAYEIALHGETIQGLTAEEAQAESADRLTGGAEEGSCRNQGYGNADNTLGDKFDGLFTLLGEEYETMFERIENDPRIRDLNAAWQLCMAEFGYAYEGSQEIIDELQTAGDGLRQGFQGSSHALELYAAAGEANLAAMSAEDRYEFLDSIGAFQGFSLVPSLQADLDALIERELTIAAHDAECADQDAADVVLREYEQQFVTDHSAQLALIASGDA